MPWGRLGGPASDGLHVQQPWERESCGVRCGRSCAAAFDASLTAEAFQCALQSSWVDLVRQPSEATLSGFRGALWVLLPCTSPVFFHFGQGCAGLGLFLLRWPQAVEEASRNRGFRGLRGGGQSSFAQLLRCALPSSAFGNKKRTDGLSWAATPTGAGPCASAPKNWGDLEAGFCCSSLNP